MLFILVPIAGLLAVLLGPGAASAIETAPNLEAQALVSEGEGAAHLHGRFRVEVEWTDFQGRRGEGEVVVLTSETVYVWFFTPGNIELLLKILDGREHNGYYWVYFGALSNVEYRVLVTDTWTGQVRTYDNPAGHFGSRGDPRAFPG